ncbi:MAG: molybdenum ABC transporter ATP-binding protein [Agarilytica sp.]
MYAQFKLAYPGDQKSPRPKSNENNNPFLLNVDLTLPASGITAIFGESGSGKTTFLRCVAGLEKTDGGELYVNGIVWQSADVFTPTHKRPLAYVFQESSLFSHLTAQGNLHYAIKRSGEVANVDSEKLYQRVLTSMGIGSLLTRYPHQLSGGERQRVAIARALLIQPRLLLMDEPLASLDAARKQEILPYLERLRSEFNVPILYVSHAMDEVARLADHVVVLSHGEVKAQGSLTEVFSRIDLPLGFGTEAGVVLQGRVVERDSHWHLMRVAFPGGELWVRDDGNEQDSPLRVRVLARDVSLALSSHEDSSILNRLPAEIAEISEDSDESMLLIRLKSGESYLIARLTRKSAQHLKLKPGMHVWAQVKSVALVR